MMAHMWLKHVKNAKRMLKKRKERRETSLKHLFPGRPSFSNVKAVGGCRLCYDAVSFEDVSTLPNRTNTDDICLLSGEFCNNMELIHEF
jgi:hypothetical protein